MAIENFTKTKAAIKIYEDLTQEEYDALAKEPHSFYLVNGVGIYKGTTLISAGANSSMDEIVEELNQAIAAKQDTLVSGTNIKTINGESILGAGNIEVAASDDGVDTAYVENEVLYIDDDTSAGGNASLTEDDVNNIISSNETVVTLTNDVRDLQTDKQDILESGTNIKTINNQSILGSGNIEIQGGSQETIDITTWLSNQTTNGFEGSVPQEYRDIERLKKALLSGTIGEHKYIFRFIEIFQDTEYNFLFIKNNALENLATVDITINIETWAIRLDGYTYQPKLESGVNIKTINNQSILGSGNITIEGGGSAPSKTTVRATVGDTIEGVFVSGLIPCSVSQPITDFENTNVILSANGYTAEFKHLKRNIFIANAFGQINYGFYLNVQDTNVFVVVPSSEYGLNLNFITEEKTLNVFEYEVLKTGIINDIICSGDGSFGVIKFTGGATYIEPGSAIEMSSCFNIMYTLVFQLISFVLIKTIEGELKGLFMQQIPQFLATSE